jgi:proteasome lid subunit RPN8/RPN11
VISLPVEIRRALVQHARWSLPNEACGLLAGTGGVVRMAYCLTNVDASPNRFTVDPVGHFGALRHAERSGLELMGVFHSHPHGPAYPSSIDRAQILEPDWVSVIVGAVGAPEPTIRAFRIRSDAVAELDVITTREGLRSRSCS